VDSRATKTLRAVGVVIVAAGLVTPLLGVECARAFVDWWTAQRAQSNFLSSARSKLDVLAAG
jgi:hypothetical protein